jgi:hypothetical protein
LKKIIKDTFIRVFKVMHNIVLLVKNRFFSDISCFQSIGFIIFLLVCSPLYTDCEIGPHIDIFLSIICDRITTFVSRQFNDGGGVCKYRSTVVR